MAGGWNGGAGRMGEKSAPKAPPFRLLFGAFPTPNRVLFEAFSAPIRVLFGCGRWVRCMGVWAYGREMRRGMGGGRKDGRQNQQGIPPFAFIGQRKESRDQNSSHPPDNQDGFWM